MRKVTANIYWPFVSLPLNFSGEVAVMDYADETMLTKYLERQ
ncbi:hypothetical protein [Sulfuriflexus mobilis]|nr:hypothetical protein [Sulfuriflexus mobilis]